GNTLTVLWDGRPVGRVTVTRLTPRLGGHLCLGGDFVPAEGFPGCLPLLAEKERYFQEYSDSNEDGAYDRFVEAVRALTRRVQLPELPGDLSDFGVEDGKVGLTIKVPGGEPARLV